MPIIQDTVQGFDFGLPPYLESGVINLLNAKLTPGLTASGGMVPESVGTTANATINTALMQAALSVGGLVIFATPGTIWINNTLFIPSNTMVWIGANTTIKMMEIAAGPNTTCIFTNANSRTAGLVLTSMTGWNSAGGTHYATCGATGIGALYPVGSYIAIMDTDQQGTFASVNRYYVGIHRVLTSSANQLTFEIANVTPGNGSGVTGVGITNFSCYVFPVDSNITITGGGTLDGNGINQLLYFAGDPRGCMTWMHNVRYVNIDNIQIYNGSTWMLGSNFVEHYRVSAIGGDSRYAGGNSGDVVHLSGWHSDVLIDGIQCASNDNIVGLTIDVCNKVGFTTLNFPYQYPGDMYDVTVKNIVGTAEGTSSMLGICAMYGPAEYGYHAITFESIGGVGSSAVQLANYAPSSMNNLNGENLLIRNVHTTNAVVQALAMVAGSVVNWTDITIEDIRSSSPNSVSVYLDGSGTINKLSVKNLYVGIPFTWNVAPITIAGTIAVSVINISMVEEQLLASGISLVSVTTSGAIKRLSLKNVSATGTGATGALLSLGASASVASVAMEDCAIDNMQAALLTARNVATVLNVNIANLTLRGTASSRAAIFAGATNFNLNGYTELTAPTLNPFQCLNAQAYNFKFENVNRDADSITKTAGTLRFHGMGARTALATMTLADMSAGDTFFDTTNTIRKIRNIAATLTNLHS